jgi:hypothetical protein
MLHVPLYDLGLELPARKAFASCASAVPSLFPPPYPMGYSDCSSISLLDYFPYTRVVYPLCGDFIILIDSSQDSVHISS